MGSTDQLIMVVGGIIAAFLVFMALREVTNWYFKINDRIKLMNDQIKLQQETNSLLRAMGKYFTVIESRTPGELNKIDVIKEPNGDVHVKSSF